MTPFLSGGPSQHAIERRERILIELGAGRADDRVRDDAAAAQHFLANGHADAFLELEAHQRHEPVEHFGGAIDVARLKRLTISTSASG